MLATPETNRKMIALTFPPENSGEPIMYNLARDHNLTFNILKARISPRKEGHMVVEIQGSEHDFRAGLNYLKDQGITIQPVAQQITRDEDSCMHCGVCTAVCPTKALALNLETRFIEFDRERCSVCGMCTQVCPVQAMHIESDELNW